ncbi:MAG: metallophosphoesterase family protein [Thermoguttaceae bacterium]
MFKFIHAADIHLDSPLLGLERYEGAPAAEIRGATRKALENLVALAIEQSVAFVVIAGDLYDGDWKEFRTGLYFVKQMARLNAAGIPVFVIAGNHDAANKMTRRLPLPANVRVLSDKEPETIRLDLWEVAIHGQSFPRRDVLENLVPSYPKAAPGWFNIGLLHTSATGYEGHDRYAPCTLDDLRAKQYDYWALGHIHKRGVLCEDPPVIFPGNLQGRHIRESGPKGCTLVTVDDHRRVQAQPQWLDVLRWEPCRVSGDGARTPEELLDRIRRRLLELCRGAEGRPLAVRVQVDGPCAAHRLLSAAPDRFMNEVRAVAHDAGGEIWIEKISLGTSLPPELNLSQFADGPLGELVQYVTELRSSPEAMAALRSELADFCEKLPAELTEGDGPLRLDQPENLRTMLDQVEQMLIHQLLSGEKKA